MAVNALGASKKCRSLVVGECSVEATLAARDFQFCWTTARATRPSAEMDERWGPIGVGLAGGLLVSFLPDVLGPVVLISAALLAGWILHRAPMKAAALFVLPTIVIGFVRMILNDASDAAGAFAFGAVIAVVVAAIFTHVGAGIALRRQA